MSTTRTENQSPRATRALTWVVRAGGAAAFGLAAAKQLLTAEHAWLVMLALALCVAPHSTVRIPGVKADVTLGDVITFACAILYGPDAAVLAAVADGTVTSLRITKKLHKLLYNVGTCAISMAAAGSLTKVVFPTFGGRGVQPQGVRVIGAVALFTFCYFMAQTISIAAYIATSKGMPVWKTWRENFLQTWVSYGASGASALTTYALVEQVGIYLVPILVGLMLTIQFSYSRYFRDRQGEFLKAGAAAG